VWVGDDRELGANVVSHVYVVSWKFVGAFRKSSVTNDGSMLGRLS
jgi:hypothetical protein